MESTQIFNYYLHQETLIDRLSQTALLIESQIGKSSNSIKTISSNSMLTISTSPRKALSFTWLGSKFFANLHFFE